MSNKTIPSEIILIFKSEQARLFKEGNTFTGALKIVKSRLGNYYVSVVRKYKEETENSPCTFEVHILNGNGEKEAAASAGLHSRTGLCVGAITFVEVYNNQSREGLGPILMSHTMDLLTKKNPHKITLVASSYKMCVKMGWNVGSNRALEYKKSLARFYKGFGFEPEENKEASGGRFVFKGYKQYPKLQMQIEDGHIVYSEEYKQLGFRQNVLQDFKKNG